MERNNQTLFNLDIILDILSECVLDPGVKEKVFKQKKLHFILVLLQTTKHISIFLNLLFIFYALALANKDSKQVVKSELGETFIQMLFQDYFGVIYEKTAFFFQEHREIQERQDLVYYYFKLANKGLKRNLLNCFSSKVEFDS